MFGGTPMNMSCRYLDDARFEVVTGLNLASLIKALTGRKEDVSLATLATEVARYGRQDISVAGELLRVEKKTEGPQG
jgi:PTS system mannose-specific IIA component